MNLSEGTHLGYINNPLQDTDIQRIIGFVGLIKISTQKGEGVILIEHGTIIAASFISGKITHFGSRALEIINATTPGRMELRSYNPYEFKEAVEACRDGNFLLVDEPRLPAIPDLLDENILQKVLVQPGVIAVSVFSEGFPIQSLGTADFDQVAAMAEDLLRVGFRIAEDMKIGLVARIVLETNSGKIIVVPYGDLFLCVFTGPDANIGLIQQVLRSIQRDAGLQDPGTGWSPAGSI